MGFSLHILYEWREDHYLETQCAHHAQQKLRNLLSSTGSGWMIGIGLCMAFLTPIPIISLILILKVIGNPPHSLRNGFSPSTFFMKWREDHYLETQCAHQAQQKLRNLLSSTGPGWLIGIGLCMAFLTPIPTISLILILKVIGNHSASIGSSHPIPQVRLDQSCSSPLFSPNGSSGLCSISPHLRRNLPKNLMKPMERSSHKYTKGLNWLCGHYSFPSSWRTFSSPQPSRPHIDIHEVRLYQTWHQGHSFSWCHPSSKPHWTSPTPTQK